MREIEEKKIRDFVMFRRVITNVIKLEEVKGNFTLILYLLRLSMRIWILLSL
jgi:hypothetical protein